MTRKGSQVRVLYGPPIKPLVKSILAGGFLMSREAKVADVSNDVSNGNERRRTEATVAGRRMNGEGGLYQRSDGRWFGAVVLGYDASGKPKRKTVSAKTKAEALQKLKDLQDKIDGGYSPPTKEETLSQLFDRWYCDILSTQVQQDARDNYKCIADCHIVPTLGRKKVAKLTVADVQHLLASKLSGGPDGDPRPLSVSTVRRIRSVLAQALEVCLVDGSLARNVAALTSAPKAAGTEGRTLTHAQAKRLLKELEGHRLGALFIVMLSTGLRRGEALGLRWDDVDLRKRVVVVRRQLRRIGGQLITREVKGRKSGRSVDLPAPVVQLLKDHRTAQAAARTGSNGLWEESGFVFTTQYGSALDPRNVHRDFQTICMKAKLGKWHPHELRHSAASLMLAEGVPLQVVSDILGHSSIRITADVYGHVLQPQRREAARAMAGALWG